MHIARRVLLLGGFGAAGLAAVARLSSAQGRIVTVFAAASLQNALEEAGRLYAARTGRQVRFSFAASSALARQIEHGAPAQIFISADEAWMAYVAERRLVAKASRADLLSNRLALIAPVSSTLRLTVGRNMPLASGLGRDGRLAVAAAEVPPGRDAPAARAARGVWTSGQDRLAPAENVRAALNFVARGEVPLGIVYDTDARVEPRVKIVGLFPAASHPKIVYPAALVGDRPGPGAAAFLAWLKSREAGAVFAKYGFTRP